MRKIKFRGKDFRGNWVYGDLIAQYPRVLYIMDGPDKLRSVSPSTVGQYTGLKDRDGKDIYDGDILVYQHPVNRRDRRFYAIGWNAHAWCIRDLASVNDPWAGDFTEFDGSAVSRYLYLLRNASVCGNRWDAPEMLK